MSSSQARAHWRDKRTTYIKNFIEDTGLNIVWLTPYQARIDRRFDVYPTNGKFFVIKEGHWGNWHTEHDLYKILEEHF